MFAALVEETAITVLFVTILVEEKPTETEDSLVEESPTETEDSLVEETGTGVELAWMTCCVKVQGQLHGNSAVSFRFLTFYMEP